MTPAVKIKWAVWMPGPADLVSTTDRPGKERVSVQTWRWKEAYPFWATDLFENIRAEMSCGLSLRLALC